MKFEFKIRHSFAVHDAKRIQFRLLMPSDSIGTDQLQYVNLFVFVIRIDDRFITENRSITTNFTECFKVPPNAGVRNIGIYVFHYGGGKGVKKRTPLFWNGFTIHQVVFVEFFDVFGVGAGQMPRAPH